MRIPVDEDDDGVGGPSESGGSTLWIEGDGCPGDGCTWLHCMGGGQMGGGIDAAGDVVAHEVPGPRLA